MSEDLMKEMYELKSLQRQGVDVSARMMRIAKSVGPEEFAKNVSPPGHFKHVKGLLEERRLHYLIPDSAFAQEAVYDRVFLWQIPRHFGETFEGTSIIMPEISHQRVEEECPRGIIVTAGMKALDNLRSNGMDLGHIVNFVRLSPYRLPVGFVRGIPLHLLILRDGDIIASEDLVGLRQEGLVETRAVLVDGSIQHRLASPDEEKTIAPKMPWIGADY